MTKTGISGTGIELAVCQKIVKYYNGGMRATSENGLELIFTLKYDSKDGNTFII